MTFQPHDVARPLQLPTDMADSRSLHAVIRGLASFEGNDAARHKVLTDALWLLWEKPRVPRPVIARKFPVAYAWSPRARQLVTEGSSGKLALEHLEPRRRLIDDLLLGAQQYDPEGLLDILRWRIATVVVTDEDQHEFKVAGMSDHLAHVDQSIWARFNETGIDRSGYAPLQESDRL